MEPSALSHWLGGPYEVLLKNPPGERVTGILSNLVPEQSLTLNNATVVGTSEKFERLDIIADNILDITRLQTLEPTLPMIPPALSPTTAPVAAPIQAQATFHDPAIVSMTRKPTIHTGHPRQAQPNETIRAPIIASLVDRLVYSSPGETDTTETTTARLPPISSLTLQTPSNTLIAVTAAKADDAAGDGLQEGHQDLTPTAKVAGSGSGPRERKRGKRNKRQQDAQNPSQAPSTSSARPTNQTKGWRQTPILQSTKSFQPFASLRSQKRRADPGADGWASEDVTDVQEAGDFDFEGSLAKFDKRTIFNEMREQDQIDDADRLVSHNRLPRPKPGTAGGRNLHYTENVLDAPPSASKITRETPGDFWRSEADDDLVNEGGETLSGREGSGRSSRLRGESRMSTTRRSRSRKTSASAIAAGPSRVNSGPSPAALALPGLYTLASNRRIDTVTHLQMLVVENVASNELGMTEDLVAENAGRGICEVAMRALADPAIQLRAAASSPPATNTVAVVAGNNKSGARAIAAARHLRNRNIHTLVCVVGIERERELLDDVRRQIRLFRNFGGTVYTKSELFEYLAQSSNSLNTSPHISVSLIVDALLGLTISFEELRKSDQATTYELMEWANRNEAFVMAIDIPSGIEPSSGRVNVIDGAKLYVQPRYVVALGAPKSGLLKAMEGMDEAGDITAADEWKVYLADLGLGATVWRKAAKIRRGADFEGNWVLHLRYQGRKET
ncbi:YjeF-related protein N-terminus-domain-containing protein [Nemania sp. NC0429]|nr:YjeF-related protein N-terminus-domain-containing protein [Nemania sp. NC0429]